jgi:ElaB/YqjD/DUF883 family membrane-anchored ribosome-binding protein
MNIDKAIDSTRNLADQATHSADAAITATQRVVGNALDSVRDGSRRVRDSALDTTEHTLDYIRAEPVKAVLIAAATGAALMAVGQMMAGHARRRD